MKTNIKQRKIEFVDASTYNPAYAKLEVDAEDTWVFYFQKIDFH